MTTIAQLIAKTHCHLFKHRRGKRLGLPENGIQVYYCPRCRKEWSRKVAK